MNINVGSYVALAGLIVTILNVFHISVLQEQVEAVIGGAVTLYGIIHQIVVSRKVAKVAGVI